MEQLIIAGLAIIAIVVIFSMIFSLWRKIPSDLAVVVTGMGDKKVVTGRGFLLIPLVQRMDYISLGAISLDISIQKSMSDGGVPINVFSNAIIKVKNERDMILLAMERFNQGNIKATDENIAQMATNVLEGLLREIVSSMTVEAIYKDRASFGEEVKKVAGSTLEKMGLEITVFTIKDITDGNQYIESLGVAKIEAVKKEAAIAKAEAEKETKIRTSEARKQGEQAQILAETEIARAQKERNLQQAEFDKEQQSAKAQTDSAYVIQENITRQQVISSESDAQILGREREKDIAIKTQLIEIAREEQNTILAQKKAERVKQELVETVLNPAEAEKDKQKIQAEAQKVRAILDAEAKAEAVRLEAKANADKMEIEALARAKQIELNAQAQAKSETLVGSAQAEVISAKGRAEAEAIKAAGLAEAEAMLKKAEAYKQYNDAAVAQMIIEKLPEIASSVAAPMEKIGNITIIGGAGSEGGAAAEVAGYVSSAMAATIQSVKATTGFDLTDVLRANTIAARTDRNVNLTHTGDPIVDTTTMQPQ